MTLLLEQRNLCGLVFDGVVQETHSKDASVTNFPVGIDSPISDHMIPQPILLTFRGLIGDYFGGFKSSNQRTSSDSLSVEDLQSSNVREFIELGGDDPNLLGLNAREFSQYRDDVLLTLRNNIGITDFGSKNSNFDVNKSGERARAAWCRLLELMDNKEVCTLVTGLKRYENVVVKSARTTTDVVAAESCKLDVIVTLQQIKRATSEEATIFQIAGGKGVNDTGKKNLNCLPLPQVFLGGLAQTNIASLIPSQDGLIQNNGNIVNPYGQDILREVIAGVYRGQRRGNTYVTTTNGLTFVNVLQENSVEDDEALFNSIVNTIQSSLYQAEEKRPGITCAITQACGDSRFVEPDIEDEDGEVREQNSNRSGDNPLETSIVIDIGTGNRGVISNVDAANQLGIRINNSEDLYRNRVNCYTREISDFLNDGVGFPETDVQFSTNGDLFDFSQLNSLSEAQLEALRVIYNYDNPVPSP